MRKTCAAVALICTALPFAAVSAASGSNFDLTSTNFSISVGEFSPLAGKEVAAATGGGITNVNTGAAHVVKIAMIGLALLCVVLIVIGGIRMATSLGKQEHGIEDGKYMIIASLGGLFLALSSYVIISTVGWVLGG
jgi:hypothetical protein